MPPRIAPELVDQESRLVVQENLEKAIIALLGHVESYQAGCLVATYPEFEAGQPATCERFIIPHFK